jgi:hypothetical protein
LQAVKGGAVFFDVEIEGLEQSHDGDAAFVFN